MAAYENDSIRGRQQFVEEIEYNEIELLKVKSIHIFFKVNKLSQLFLGCWKGCIWGGLERKVART